MPSELGGSLYRTKAPDANRTMRSFHYPREDGVRRRFPFFVGGAPPVYTGSHIDVSECHTSRDDRRARLALTNYNNLSLRFDSDSVCTRAKRGDVLVLHIVAWAVACL
jgi:hypothetical protein